jgi:hypothetical protein
MTDYSDIPQVNALYQEQEQVQSAIDYLTNGGGITMMTVSPPPAIAGISPMMQMAVNIQLALPNPQSLIDQALSTLQQRQSDINDQLTALDITNTPAMR